MERLTYIVLVLGVMAWIAFILNSAFTDPAAFAANQGFYMFWTIVIVIGVFVVACLSSGKWMMAGLTTFVIGAWWVLVETETIVMSGLIPT